MSRPVAIKIRGTKPALYRGYIETNGVQAEVGGLHSSREDAVDAARKALDSTAAPVTAPARRACFACSHVHADGPGTCWEAACAPECPEDHGDYSPGVYPYTGDQS